MLGNLRITVCWGDSKFFEFPDLIVHIVRFPQFLIKI